MLSNDSSRVTNFFLNTLNDNFLLTKIVNYSKLTKNI